jgi:hypothetical protein
MGFKGDPCRHDRAGTPLQRVACAGRDDVARIGYNGCLLALVGDSAPRRS